MVDAHGAHLRRSSSSSSSFTSFFFYIIILPLAFTVQNISPFKKSAAALVKNIRNRRRRRRGSGGEGLSRAWAELAARSVNPQRRFVQLVEVIKILFTNQGNIINYVFIFFPFLSTFLPFLHAHSRLSHIVFVFQLSILRLAIHSSLFPYLRFDTQQGTRFEP